MLDREHTLRWLEQLHFTDLADRVRCGEHTPGKAIMFAQRRLAAGQKSRRGGQTLDSVGTVDTKHKG